MDQNEYKVYGYRWVVLLAFMFVIALNQLLWITFAPITGTAAEFYGVSDLSIGLLSLSFMAVYILVSIPASWTIDTYGIRVAVGIGVVFTGLFGLLRGILAPSYTMDLITQIGIAIGQPFILNAMTTVTARWFPIKDRATASGLGSLAIYLGIIIGLALPPYQINKATVHATVSEFWYVLEGSGEIWRDDGQKSSVTPLLPGTAIDIPVGTAFQYRNISDLELKFICISMPRWPGDSEATFIKGIWQATV